MNKNEEFKKVNKKIDVAKYIGRLVVFVVVTAIIGFLILKLALPQYYFNAYPLIPFCFLFFGIALIAVIRHSERSGKPVTQGFMMLKGIKLLAAVTIIILYAVIVKTQIKEFAITFVVLYLAYLVFETVTLSKLQGGKQSAQQTDIEPK